MKHTPGPWKAAKIDGCWFIKAKEDVPVCADETGAAEANARLIAAAPLMFEVFQAIASGNFEDKESFHEWAKGRAAVVLDAVETGC